MKNTRTKKLIIKTSISLFSLGLFVSGCGDEKKAPSGPEVKAAQDALGFPGGELPKDDASLIDFKNIPDGKYVFTEARSVISHADTGGSYIVGFEIDKEKNQIVNNKCVPNSQAKEIAAKGVRGAYLSFSSPESFSVKSKSYDPSEDFGFSLTAEMTSSNDACELSVYASTASNSELQVMNIFTGSTASKNGHIYSQPFSDGQISAAIRRSTNGGLEILYKVSTNQMGLIGVLYFTKQ